jgi:hypothetical protein
MVMCVKMSVMIKVNIRLVGVTLSPGTLRGAVQLRGRLGKQARPRDDNGP